MGGPHTISRRPEEQNQFLSKGDTLPQDCSISCLRVQPAGLTYRLQLASPHNCVSQFLKINLLHTHTHTYMFLWRTLTDTYCSNSPWVTGFHFPSPSHLWVCFPYLFLLNINRMCTVACRAHRNVNIHLLFSRNLEFKTRFPQDSFSSVPALSQHQPSMGTLSCTHRGHPVEEWQSQLSQWE